ncbi:MAG TPA: DUF805 domain-containing protein [Xanthomonadaceae bacterium]|nr:DUF805 domain-containing protein [Xanthomonadaceae bacterium]
MDWMLMPLRRYADFSGRSRRKEYWMFQLLMLLVYMPLGILMGIGAAIGSYNGSGALFYLALVAMLLLMLAVFIPGLAVQVRRFHDQDKSGWFVLFNLVPYVGGFVVLVFMCLRGTPGPNRFGDDPVND